jgi:hypothetical protein
MLPRLSVHVESAVLSPVFLSAERQPNDQSAHINQKMPITFSIQNHLLLRQAPLYMPVFQIIGN